MTTKKDNKKPLLKTKLSKPDPIKSEVILCSSNPYFLEFNVSGAPMRANQLLGQHWTKRKKNADTYKTIVRYLVAKHKPENLLTSVKLSITIFKSRLCDYDGAVSTLKPIIDGLKDLILLDDSYEITGPWDVRQVKVKHKYEEKINVQVFEIM